MCEKPKCCSAGPRASVVLAVVVLAVIVAKRHTIAHAVGVAVHIAALAGLFLLAAAAVVLAVVLAIKLCPAGVRQHRVLEGASTRFRRRITPVLRNVPRAIWAAVCWHWFTRNAGLAYADNHARDKGRRRIVRPRARIRPTAHGIAASVRAKPRAGRAEFEQAAEHLADHWRVQRVSVSQPRPNRLAIRGLVRDPLLERLHLEDVPGFAAPRKLLLGRDEHGQWRSVDIANCPGVCVGGMPGAGKSTEVTLWLVQLSPCVDVQFALIDGKGAGEFDDFADRAYAMAGDDLDEALGVLEMQHGLMTDRLACIRRVLGVKNVWHVGVSASWPLSLTLIDECQSHLDLTMVKGDKAREPKVRRAIFLTSSLVRRGRSVGMFTVPATQKPTTDSLPSAIRDNCPLSLCFGVKTMDAAAATLGSAIRQYESHSPVLLADPAYAGCCTATLKTGQDPFTFIRGPYISEDQAAEVAKATAHLRRDPRVLLPVAVPDDASELVS
jgi:DNA segregation ATPase FtsK/SpoIIIE, S-DNA-T family